MQCCFPSSASHADSASTVVLGEVKGVQSEPSINRDRFAFADSLDSVSPPFLGQFNRMQVEAELRLFERFSVVNPLKLTTPHQRVSPNIFGGDNGVCQYR